MKTIILSLIIFNLVQTTQAEITNPTESPSYQSKNETDFIEQLRKEVGVETKDKNGNTPLHRAARAGYPTATQMLITASANIEAKNNLQSTPLHLAAFYGNPEVVKILIKSNANVHATNFYGTTPLGLAITNGDKAMAEILISNKADVHHLDNKKNNFFHILAKSNLDPKDIYEMTKYLIQKGVNIHAKNSEGFSPLGSAVNYGPKEMVELLIEKGAGIDRLQKHHINHSLLYLASKRGSYETVKLLLDKGLSPIEKQLNKTRPIDVAIFNNHFEIADLLIKKGETLNVKDKEGNNLLHKLTMYYKVGNKKTHPTNLNESIKYLTENGVDINEKNKSGFSPLRLALTTLPKELLEVFIKNGADVSILNSNKDTLLHKAAKRGLNEKIPTLVEAFNEQNIDINSKNKGGFTPVAVAIHEGRLDTAKILIENGVDINVRDLKGDHILHHIISKKDSSEAIKIIEMLSEYKIDINSKDKNGLSPLAIAISKNNIDVARALISNGADTKFVDSLGRTLLHIAVANNLPGVVEFLVSEQKVDVHKADLSDTRALDISMESLKKSRGKDKKAKQISAVLIEAGADISKIDISEVDVREVFGKRPPKRLVNQLKKAAKGKGTSVKR